MLEEFKLNGIAHIISMYCAAGKACNQFAQLKFVFYAYRKYCRKHRQSLAQATTVQYKGQVLFKAYEGPHKGAFGEANQS